MDRHYPFELQPLPYSYHELSPELDELTLHFHHDKHLQTYVDNLNKALEPYPNFHDWTLEELLIKNEVLPEEIRQPVKNNAGGVYNHELYFHCMGKNKGSKPEGTLAEAINVDFGSYGEFKAKFKQEALNQFGSGWAWLIHDVKCGLHIIRLPNQDTPLPYQVYPLLLVDVWEHAYYLQYQNRRAEYLDYWFQIVDWQKIGKKYHDHCGV